MNKKNIMKDALTKVSVELGNYLLSDERIKSFENNENFPNGELLEERLSVVHDADIVNCFQELL